MGLSMNTVADCLRRHYRVVVFAVYLAVVIVTMAFHEPWFDEAQSWLIARDCLYRDLLLVRPHYEGHPPLWWLLQSIPAKLCVPYERGLKGVELVCSALMCGLLVFRAPLPRLAVALLPSLVWTAAAIACDIRYDYSAGRALATFVRNNNLEHDRWVSFWRYLPDMTWPDGTHTNRMEDTHRYSWPAIAANPYFARNLLDCTYEGRTFVPNQVPSRAQMNREIASCAAKGAPEFLVGDTDFPQYFFHRLGLKRGDYRQIVVASQHVPWKTWVTSSDIAVYVRSDVYRTLPHA